MKLFKVEFFDKDFGYVGSHEIGDFTFEYDYLSLSNNEIAVLETTECEIGNLVYIDSMVSDEHYIGIVTSVEISNGAKKVKFKSFLECLNVKVKYDDVTNVESWISSKILETYNNDDVYQRMPIITNVITNTSGTLESDDYFVNLYEMIEMALRKYQITLNFNLDLSLKKIVCKIGKVSNEKLVIEADLPNVINSNISVKSNDESSVNKITIVNTSDQGNNESVTYCRHTDGTIDTDLTDDRIIPVVFDLATISCKSEEFDEKAQNQAESTLAQDKLNNLIEITVTENDELVNPNAYVIGQEVEVISKDKVFNSVLTGIKYSKGQKTLIFGAIRLELTKIIKRRLKNGN